MDSFGGVHERKRTEFYRDTEYGWKQELFGVNKENNSPRPQLVAARWIAGLTRFSQKTIYKAARDEKLPGAVRTSSAVSGSTATLSWSFGGRPTPSSNFTEKTLIEISQLGTLDLFR